MKTKIMVAGKGYPKVIVEVSDITIDAGERMEVPEGMTPAVVLYDDSDSYNTGTIHPFKLHLFDLVYEVEGVNVVEEKESLSGE